METSVGLQEATQVESYLKRDIVRGKRACAASRL